MSNPEHQSPEPIEAAERSQAKALVCQIKNTLLGNPDDRKVIFNTMSERNGTLGRLLKAENFGSTEKSKNFVVDEFFKQNDHHRDGGVSVLIPRGEYEYLVTWHYDSKEVSTVRVIKFDNREDSQPRQGETAWLSESERALPNNISYVSTPLDAGGYESGEPIEMTGLEAKPRIDAFLADLLAPKNK